jgi:DNA transformation protein
MPERLYDDPDELAIWAERALAVARRASEPKAKPEKGRAAKRATRTPRR